MLTALTFRDKRLVQTPLQEDEPMPADVVWVDLVDPSAAERARVQEAFDQALPTPEEVEEIEATSRFFKDADGLHIHSYFLHDFEDTPVNVTVAFTLNGGRLFTLRDQELATFRMLRLQARRQPGMLYDAVSILLSLFAAKTDRLADILEEVYQSLETASSTILARETNSDIPGALARLAEHEDLNGKARMSLMDTQRALSFILRSESLGKDHRSLARDMLRDIESLLPHTAFLFDKINFLMDALMGLVNIEQNQIIKIFSIAAVVFLPPTLVASIYGMNFHHMPELSWPWGYPFAVVLMILSGIAPYWYFKRKGWL
ncbi:MAG TPA: magnesium/cobalt transporter CorA [Gammaproteobacteria bacterium]|nr:magnesium/cobalt transporter CorA [Gammaproteobacteria bacterium]